MKAITIWQPWASLLATGEKIYETRKWPTRYRGPIAIHAAMKSVSKLPATPELEKYALHNDKIGEWTDLPRGKIIAIGELVDCWHIVFNPGTDVDVAALNPIGAESMVEDKHAAGFGNYFIPTEKEKALGYWVPGWYAWEIRIKEILREPVSVRGQQGLWNWDEVLPDPAEDLPFPEVLP